jgi:DNA-binding transcriptional MocR family regulator
MLCSSFSKSLSPSLRIGFVAAGRYRPAMALQKTITSGGTNPVTQHVLAEYLESGAYERHLRGLRRCYERQVEAMRDGGCRHFPAATRITQPQAGYVLWVELPGEHRYHRAARPADAQGSPMCRASCSRPAACTATACA